MSFLFNFYKPLADFPNTFRTKMRILSDSFISQTFYCRGDFNVHLNIRYPGSKVFLDFLSEFGFYQSLDLATHDKGNILHLILPAEQLDICIVDVVFCHHKALNFKYSVYPQLFVLNIFYPTET